MKMHTLRIPSESWEFSSSLSCLHRLLHYLLVDKIRHLNYGTLRHSIIRIPSHFIRHCWLLTSHAVSRHYLILKYQELETFFTCAHILIVVDINDINQSAAYHFRLLLFIFLVIFLVFYSRSVLFWNPLVFTVYCLWFAITEK